MSTKGQTDRRIAVNNAACYWGSVTS